MSQVNEKAFFVTFGVWCDYCCTLFVFVIFDLGDGSVRFTKNLLCLVIESVFMRNAIESNSEEMLI